MRNKVQEYSSMPRENSCYAIKNTEAERADVMNVKGICKC